MAVKDALLPEFDHEMAVTRRVLERVPFSDPAWKPHAKSMTIAQLAAHIATIPSWVPVTLGSDAFDVASMDEDSLRATHETTAALLAEFDKHVAAARTLITEASDAQMMQPWSLKSGEQVVFTLPRAAVLRSFVFNHSVHHRGQMSVYLRLRDVPVPSIYGPSADEQ
jgi:uncharacterized damage-inducible protein DinB